MTQPKSNLLIGRRTGKRYLVGGNPVTPPQLSGDAPVTEEQKSCVDWLYVVTNRLLEQKKLC